MTFLAQFIRIATAVVVFWLFAALFVASRAVTRLNSKVARFMHRSVPAPEAVASAK